jgi:transposase-like protein
MGVLDQRKGALVMGKRRQRPEQIISKLREAEVELARGMKVPEVCKKLGIAEYTYYRWRKEYGGLRLDQARRLKKLIAELSLDNAILREAAQGNF